MKILFRVIPYFRGYVTPVAFAYVLIAIQAIATLAVPGLIGVAVDAGVTHHDQQQLLIYGGLILLVSAIRGLAAFGQGYLGESSAQGVGYELRKALYSHMQNLSFSFHDQTQTGELLSRATQDVEAMRMFTGRAVLMIFNIVLLLVGVSIALLRMDWRLALMAILVLPALMWRSDRFARKIRPMFTIVQQQIAAVGTVVQENAAGVRVVKAFGRELQEMTRFRTQNDVLYDEYIKTAREQAFNTPLLDLLSNGSTLLMLWLGGYLVIRGNLTYGELTAFYTYLLQIVGPIRRGGWLISMGSRAAAGAERVFEILDTPLGVESKPGAAELPSITGAVEFQDVTCSYYPGRPVLQDVTFSVRPGMMVALVGATGSGKTTVANLIPRYYDVSSGRVLVDGHDVRDVELQSLRRQVAVVMQETTLFTGSIRDNIAFGRPDATDEEVRAATRAARAEEFLLRLPQGLDTIVGERGMSLSGGQKQRVSIARALLMDPRLLILDEFTSAVDVATERLIRAALQELMNNRTTFVIAHRISTVRSADLILVLDRGRMVASGTHDELLETSEHYRDIYAGQLMVNEAELMDKASAEHSGARLQEVR